MLLVGRHCRSVSRRAAADHVMFFMQDSMGGRLAALDMNDSAGERVIYSPRMPSGPPAKLNLRFRPGPPLRSR